MKKSCNKFVGILIIAIILILISVLTPLFKLEEVGTFNFKDVFNPQGFIDICKMIGANGPGVVFKSLPVLFTAAVFVPAILLFLFALLRSKVMCIISSLLGIGCLGYAFYGFSKSVSSSASYFGNVANIPLATWIAALLFIVAFIWACAIKVVKPAKK